MLSSLRWRSWPATSDGLRRLSPRPDWGSGSKEMAGSLRYALPCEETTRTDLHRNDTRGHLATKGPPLSSPVRLLLLVCGPDRLSLIAQSLIRTIRFVLLRSAGANKPPFPPSWRAPALLGSEKIPV